MKISIEKIKVEEDGTEILYIAHIGFVIKSETFSGPLKRCLEKGKEEKGKDKEKVKEDKEEKDIDLEAFIPALTQIISQITMQAPPQHQAGAEAPPQTKEPTAEDKKTVPE